MSELDELKALAETVAATSPGPWRACVHPSKRKEDWVRMFHDVFLANPEAVGQMFHLGRGPATFPEGRTLAIVGNGPHSQLNVRYFAALAPEIVLNLISGEHARDAALREVLAICEEALNEVSHTADYYQCLHDMQERINALLPPKVTP